MSEKRKFDSNSDSEDEPNEEVSGCKRKPEEESVDDDERNQLKAFEDKYDTRYTAEDPEYKTCLERPDPGPPILANYFGKNRNRDNWRRDDRRGRGGYHQNDRNFHQNRRDNWNQRPYNRY